MAGTAPTVAIVIPSWNSAGLLPRWMGWVLIAAYAWFVGTGFLG